jgi:hypothetical protein
VILLGTRNEERGVCDTMLGNEERGVCDTLGNEGRGVCDTLGSEGRGVCDTMLGSEERGTRCL